MCAAVCGQTPEEAVHELAVKALTHLAPNEAARLAFKNASTLSAADVSKIQAGFERETRRRVRNAAPVDVTVTISENAHGFLLIAQVKDAVEMAAFRIEPALGLMTASIAKTMVWRQEVPILDVAVMDDQLIVLDTQSVTRYEHRTRAESIAIPGPMPRDPRGRLEVAGAALTVFLPGVTCRGTSKPMAMECSPGGEITAGRNTLDEPDWPAHYSRAHSGETDFVGETDGRVHVYDSARKETGAFDGWGSDFMGVCGGTRVLAPGAGNQDARDYVAVFDMAGGNPARVSDVSEFPGPVTALTGTTAIARNVSTGRYEAYTLTVDCGR